jgi:DNA-binding transcriptional LysR family regulator
MQPYRHMAVFVAVAEAGSFTLAARRLGIAKSAVSKAISELEHQVGISLFSRSTRRVTLTEPGAAYFEGCSRMVAEAATAATALQDFRAEPTGRLRVTAPHGLARLVLPILGELALRHNKLLFDIRLETRYANLVEEDIDVAVRGGPLEDSALVTRTLALVKYVVCASPGYLREHGVPRSMKDLAGHDWISHEHSPIQLSARRHGRISRVTVRARWRTDSGVAILELLRGGQGISLAPMWEVLEDLRGGKLRAVLADHDFKSSGIYAVCPAGRHRLPKVMAFTRLLAERLSNRGWDCVEPHWCA